jgi:hypothetical protein
MGREVRHVHKDWVHPRDIHGRHIPLFEGEDIEALRSRWDDAGHRPDPSDYMPNWPDSERTHVQMYMTVSPGTPISPVCETPEDLARWLVDNGASAFGDDTATYEQWLAVARGGYAPTAVEDESGIKSGVAGINPESRGL